MDIRRATAADADRLVPLFDDLDHPATPTQLRQRLTRLEGDPTYLAWVAHDQRQFLGFAAGHLLHPLEDDAPAAQLIALVTTRTTRGEGVGTQLVRTFEAWAVSHGAVRAILTSSHHRHRAHAFYGHRGYASTGLRLVKSLS